MTDVGWLKQSLAEAKQEAERIPVWAKQILDAREAYHGPNRVETVPDQPVAPKAESTVQESASTLSSEHNS
jgi:hypothetical protein